ARSDAPPPHGGAFTERVGERGTGVRGAREHAVQREFAGQRVGRDPGDVPDLAVHLEAAGLGFTRPVLDILEVAVDEVDPLAVDREPRTAVRDLAPLSGFEYFPGEAERPYRRGIDRAPVVEPEIPIAVGPGGTTCPRPAERHRLDARD